MTSQGQKGSAIPSLSVVMPVHDGLPFVDLSISSILAQDHTDFELVIGDDGSTDGTSEHLARWAATDPRIRLLRRERKSGVAQAGSWVVGEARAPIVAIAHADDLSRPGRLRRQLAILDDEADVDLVGCLCDGIDESGAVVRPGDYRRLLGRSPFAPFGHSSVMFRKDSYLKVGGYRAEAQYWEDMDLYLRLVDVGRIVIIPEVLSTVRFARVSTRVRDNAQDVDWSVDLMYRAVEEFVRRGYYRGVLEDLRRLEAPSRLHPFTFVGRASTLVWSGRRPGLLGRMLATADWRLDARSAAALLWVVWASLSPKSLVRALRAWMWLHEKGARRRIDNARFIDWRPGRPTQPRLKRHGAKAEPTAVYP